MRDCVFLLLTLLMASPVWAQRDNTRPAKGSSSHASPQACRDLDKIGTAVDDRFNRENDRVLAAIAGPLKPINIQEEDATWDTLIDCANETKSDSIRAEALRVLAIWESLRAESFKQALSAAQLQLAKLQTVSAAQPAVSAAVPRAPALEPQNADAANSSPTAAEVRSRNKEQLQKFLLASTGPVSIAVSSQLDNEDIRQIVEHNRALCDQVITVAELTPSGLALNIPPLGLKYMEKNSSNYPRMCLVQDTDRVTLGALHYLLVYSYYDRAFFGFQPVTRATPVSGAGTITNRYGRVWNFTYSGTVTESMEAPYVIQSRSLYVYAYDESGRVISHHSMSASSQAGGDASYAAGYNAAQLIVALWNNPSHLITSVLRDIQKDSGGKPQK